MRRFFSRGVLALICTVPPVTAGSLNSLQIIQSALSPSCMEYRITGMCYWLFCTLYGCTVKTAVKVRHYIPDAVVSAYNQTGGNPWSEMAFTGTGIAGLAEGGGANEQKRPGHKINLRFKNADVIGHPALASPLFNQFSGAMGMTCAGGGVPLMPYFLSTLDGLAWRSGLPESFYPEALTPGMRDIGSAVRGDMWGSLYPRSGFVTQTHDYKAAAVTAQRAADIVTRSGQPHVYQPLRASARPGYWPPEPVRENTRNHKWQRLTPSPSSSCATFPESRTPVAADGAYAWALWRPYSCCKRRGQRLLYSMNFQ